MGKMGENPDAKSQLVTEICSILSKSSTCAHSRHHPRKPTFIDWYLLLQVDEDAGIDAIRKRYLQLALLLHPDKNRHPKAEIAFKLISEAYACLSDKSRRKAFNCERKSSFCKECNIKCHHPRVLDMGKSKRCDPTTTEQTRSYRVVVQALKEVSNRLKEEAEVMEKCMRANAAAAATREEFPLFNPSDYVVFSNYPHQRARVLKKPFSNDFWELRMGNDVTTTAWCYRGKGRVSGSPVYRPMGTDTQYSSRERRQARAGWNE